MHFFIIVRYSFSYPQITQITQINIVVSMSRNAEL